MANIDLSKFGGKPVDRNKAEQAVEKQQSELTPPAQLAPPESQVPGTQSSGPSAVSTGSLPVEPKAPTRPVADIPDPNGGSAVTDMDPPPGNPRVSGASDVFSPASDPFKRTGDAMRAAGVEVPFNDSGNIKGRNKKTGQVLVQQGGTLKWVDEKAYMTAPVQVEKQEDPDFIASDIPFIGQARGPGEKRFKVQLTNEPSEYVFAKDRLEAQVRYNQRLGIISTIATYNITEAELKPTNDNNRNTTDGESEPTE